MNKSLIALGLLASCAVHADVGDTWLTIHGFSSHLDSGVYYLGPDEQSEAVAFREVNPGLGVAYEFIDSVEARAGFFLNSFDNTSAYAALNWHTSYSRPVAVGLMAGVVTGYQDTTMESDVFAPYDISPLFLPMLSAGTDVMRVEMGFIPKIAEGQSSIVTLSFNVKY